MNLALDIGNTRTKAGFFRQGALVAVHTFTPETLHSEFPAVLRSILKGSTLQYTGLVCVGDRQQVHALDFLRSEMQDRFLEIGPGTPAPLRNGYATPETLGMDRFMAATGAWARTGGPVVVVDAGTAMKFDYVDAAGVYRGGGISPGLRMRFRALHTQTARLPLLEPAADPPLVGDSTAGSMQSGVVNGMIAEVNGILDQYRSLAGPGLHTCLTGGDAAFLQNRVKNLTFADSHLLLHGIEATLSHYATHV